MIMQVYSRNIERQASIWAERQHDGLAPEDEALLQQWLAADPAHRQAYDQACAQRIRVERIAQALARAPERQTLPVRAAIALDQRSPRCAPWRRALAGLVAVLVLAVVMLWPDYRTGTGEIRVLALPDGSRLTLNANTRIDVDFSSAERRIRLSAGEVFAQVAHDAQRPFYVQTPLGQVRAVGTAFSVRSFDEQHRVLVSEGVVEVSAKGGNPPRRVAANEMVLIAERVGLINHLSPDQVNKALAWREHRLYFDNVALSEFVKEMNRYSSRKLIVADSELDGIRVGGAFAAGDTDAALTMLSAGFGVRAVSVSPWLQLLYPESSATEESF